MRYGVDVYSRYVEDDDGERYAVERYPYWTPIGPRVIWHHVCARLDILRWYWATRHQRDLWRY